MPKQIENKNYVEFELSDLLPSKFCILLKPDVQRELIEKAASKFRGNKGGRKNGSYNGLTQFLKSRCGGLKHLKLKSIQDNYITLWRKSKMFIPIDVLIELCKLTSWDIKEVKKDCIILKHIDARNGCAISFNFKYDEPLAFISEAIKTDGHMKTNLQQISFSSEFVELIEKFKSCLYNLGIQERNIYEFLRIEAEAPNLNIKKVVNEMGKELRFFLYKKMEKNKIALDNFTYGDYKYYKIFLENERVVELRFFIPYDSRIESRSSYGQCGATIGLMIINMSLAHLLFLLCGVPPGKKSEIIRISENIWESSESVKKVVISVIFACEGWVDSNRIRIYSNSSSYIKDIETLLKDWESIEKFKKSFNLIVKDKIHKLNQIIIKDDRYFKHDESLRRTLCIIKKHQTATINQIAKELNRSWYTIWSNLKKAMENGYVDRNSNILPHKYLLTSFGKKFLE